MSSHSIIYFVISFLMIMSYFDEKLYKPCFSILQII